jgi:high-affinity Fe2+/Pb2+ permease
MTSNLASWVFGGLFALFLMAVVAYRLRTGDTQPIDPTVNRILGIICAALAGLFAFFFSGTVAVQLGANAGSVGNIAVQATGGIGLFVLVLWWWRSNLAPAKAGGEEDNVPIKITKQPRPKNTKIN